MQWIAMVTMLIDHVGATWFGDQILFRMIGRIAFPIYAYYVVQGMAYTSDRSRYVMRLGMLALISQAPFSMLFDTWTVNVIGTFFICVLGLYVFTNDRYSIWIRGTSIALCAIVLLVVPCDYGIYALVLMLIYRYGQGYGILLGHIGLNLVFVLGQMSSDIQLWSIWPSVIFSISSERVKRAIRDRRAPKSLWRAFYPGHLIVLLLIESLIGS